jgi:ferrous-iron efflux pump FieF
MPMKSSTEAPPAPGQRNRLTFSAGFASVAVSATLVALKLWALAETGALSIAASAADSAIDLMMSLGAAAAIVYAARPADEDHAFGHTSAEDLAALAQAAFIVVAAVVIGWGAVNRLLAPEPTRLQAEGWGMAIMLVSILLTLALVWWQGRVARATGNRVVAADRLHYLGDLVPGVGALIALWASSRFGMGSVDSVIALGAAVFMVLGAVRIGKAAWDALMDRSADPAILAGISEIARDWPGVRDFHDLKTRTAGSRIFVNLHIELDGDQSLRDAHAIGASLRREIIRRFPQTDVIIHKDVFDRNKAPTPPEQA